MAKNRSRFYISPTKLKVFLNCPREYWFRYENPETEGKQPEKSYFTLGHHVHDTLRDFFDIEPTDRTENTLLHLLEANWKTNTGKAAGFLTPEQEEEALGRAKKMLNLFLETENWRVKPYYLPPKRKPGEKFSGYISVPINDGVYLGGVIDRVDEEDGKLHVVDYKTGRGDEPDEWQLPMYAVLMGRYKQRPIEKTSYLFLEYGKRHPDDINPQKNADTIMRVLDVVAKIPKTGNKEDFVCKDGDECRHCNYLLEIGFDPKTGLKLDHEEAPADPYSPDLPF